MVHYCPLVGSKINQQVIEKERKRKAPVHKVLPLHTSHMPKLSSQVSWPFPVSRSLTSSVLGLGQLGQPSVGYCNTAQMIYEVKLAQKAPVWPQQYSHLCFRPGETETRPLPAISATAGPGKPVLLINHCIKGEAFIKAALLSLLYLIAMILQ